MATSTVTLNNSTWTQVSTGNVYIDNQYDEVIYWVGATSQPAADLALTSAHFIINRDKNTIALDQAIWAKSVSESITIPVTGF